MTFRNFSLFTQIKDAKPVLFLLWAHCIKGHISLITESKEHNELTVCSIFVNPAQFNDPKDYEKYPITLEADILLLEQSGCDILFLPSVKEIYPGNTIQAKHYDLGYLESVLEGQYRPGHFQGVCRVIDRLLTIVKPYNLYLGQKITSNAW